jgi:hypothetical protein
MKLVALILLLASYQCGSAATDTNVLALGDWSEPVGDLDGYTIRGRLLICETPHHRGARGYDTAVYLELQECSDFLAPTMQVYCNMKGTVALGGHPDAQGRERIEKAAAVWELRDASGKPVPESGGASGGGGPGAYWMTLPCDSTIRLRATVYGGGRMEDGSLAIFLPGQSWVVPSRSTNEYFLSATFAVDPPTNSFSHLEYHVWQGTLKLPKLKIPVKKP